MPVISVQLVGGSHKLKTKKKMFVVSLRVIGVGCTRDCNFGRLKEVNNAKIDFSCLVISDSYRFVYARP